MKNKKNTINKVAEIKKFTAVLLELYQELEVKYAIVKPMMFDRDLIRHYNEEKNSVRGFLVIRNALLFKWSIYKRLPAPMI